MKLESLKELIWSYQWRDVYGFDHECCYRGKSCSSVLSYSFCGVGNDISEDWDEDTVAKRTKFVAQVLKYLTPKSELSEVSNVAHAIRDAINEDKEDMDVIVALAKLEV